MLVGIQGSGKGTQARRILDKFDYKLFDTGAELRRIAQGDTELGQKIKAIIESGNYVPSEYIRDTIAHFIETNKNSPVLFDGPIRSAEQDKVIRPILGKCVVICLDLSPEIAISRLLSRRIDPETGETFPEDFVWDINPKTGNTLIHRKDDTEEAIQNRIKWSLEESLPLINIWKKDNYEVFHIDANRHIDEVFEEISTLILSLKK